MLKPLAFCFLFAALSACASSSDKGFTVTASKECPLFARSIAGAQIKLR